MHSNWREIYTVFLQPLKFIFETYNDAYVSMQWRTEHCFATVMKKKMKNLLFEVKSSFDIL